MRLMNICLLAGIALAVPLISASGGLTQQQRESYLPQQNFRWRKNSLHYPGREELTAKIQQDHLANGFPPLPAGNPVVIGNIVLVRTSGPLLAGDYTTGKWIWEFPWTEPALIPLTQPRRSREAIELEQRVWLNTLQSQISTDGTNVFTIHVSFDQTDIDGRADTTPSRHDIRQHTHGSRFSRGRQSDVDRW